MKRTPRLARASPAACVLGAVVSRVTLRIRNGAAAWTSQSSVVAEGALGDVTASDGSFDPRCAARPYDLAAVLASSTKVGLDLLHCVRQRAGTARFGR
jgi:hypothetical protein